MEIIDEFIVYQLNNKDSHNNIELDKQYKLLYVTDESRKFIYTLIDDKIYGFCLFDNKNKSNNNNSKLTFLETVLRNENRIKENKELFIKIEKGYVYLYIGIYNCYSLFQTNNTYLENNKELFTIYDGYILK